MPHPLTPMQLQLLHYVRDHIQTHDYAPTMPELAAHYGIKPSTAHGRINVLVRKGWLKRVPNIHRGLMVVPVRKPRTQTPPTAQ